MTDRFNLSFTNDEHELFVWLQNQKNASGLLKDLLRSYRNGEQSIVEKKEPETDQVIINALMRNFIGEDVENYGGEKAFLRYVGKPAMNRRVSMLMTAHPVEAASVIRAAKERYPLVGELL